jgi:hypothetical protein
MTARINPVRAPSNPSVIESVLNVRRPWPLRRNPVHAIIPVHKTARTFIAAHIREQWKIVSQTALYPASSLLLASAEPSHAN